MQISKEQMFLLQQNLIELMNQKVKHYASDFIYDLYKMNELNDKNELENKMAVLFRETGCEFGSLDYDRIIYNWGGNPIRYIIDFNKLSMINENDLSNYSNLSENHDKNCVITLMEF